MSVESPADFQSPSSRSTSITCDQKHSVYQPHKGRCADQNNGPTMSSSLPIILLVQ
jgi:hypothetical protein